jgi:hypothetical protein
MIEQIGMWLLWVLAIGAVVFAGINSDDRRSYRKPWSIGGLPGSIGILGAALFMLLLTGCGIFTPPPVVTTQQTPCSSLVPDEWKVGVPGVPLPGLDAVIGEVFAALDGQTGRLDQANGRTRDSIGIVERCEKRDQEAVKRATRRWWQIF